MSFSLRYQNSCVPGQNVCWKFPGLASGVTPAVTCEQCPCLSCEQRAGS